MKLQPEFMMRFLVGTVFTYAPYGNTQHSGKIPMKAEYVCKNLCDYAKAGNLLDQPCYLR
jgi:hypothetical protein